MQPRGPDRELVGAGAEQPSLHADTVAEVEQLVNLEVQLRHRVLPDVDLHPGAAVGQHEEIRLAEGADRQDPAARDGLDPIGLELVVRPLTVRVDELRDRVPTIESPRVDVDAEPLELSEIRSPLIDLFFLRSHAASAHRINFLADGIQHPIDEFY